MENPWIPAESVNDQEVSQHARDSYSQDDDAYGVVGMCGDVYRRKRVGRDDGVLVLPKEKPEI